MSRIITASRFQKGVASGKIEIQAYTKHGSTTIVGISPPDELVKGETLKTKERMFGAKEFRVLGAHKKPMKLPGDWYEVQVIEAPPVKPGPTPLKSVKAVKPRRS